MSLQFRYKLDKKTFKGKKAPSKRVSEDHISADQRGSRSSGDDSPLVKDDQTITPVESKEKPKELSRRDILSFARFGQFAESLEETATKPKKSSEEKEAKSVEGETEVLDENDPVSASVEGEETAEASAVDEVPQEVPVKKGFFRRVIDKIRPGSKDEKHPEASEAADPAVAEKDGNTDNPVGTIQQEILREQKEAIEAYKADYEKVDDGEDPDKEYDRRTLLRQGVHFFAKPAFEKVQSKIEKVNNAVDKITKRLPLIRPPGAISERAFLQACTRCDKCMHACPKDAIQRVPKKMGFLIMGTPYIDPKKNPCVMCDDLPCISACPDDALMPVPSPADVKMGYAILDKTKCAAWGDSFCQQCVIDCPIPGAIIQDNDNRPTIDRKTCTGCGVCLRSCSTVNIPVAIKIKPQMVIEHQIRKKQLEKERARIEAERLEAARAEAEESAQTETES